MSRPSIDFKSLSAFKLCFDFFGRQVCFDFRQCPPYLSPVLQGVTVNVATMLVTLP